MCIRDRAGVSHMIHFQQRPVSALSHPKKYGFIITNPPYGERIEEKENLPALYREIGEAYRRLDAWSMYTVSYTHLSNASTRGMREGCARKDASISTTCW